jgi:poly-gamma-glutamate capsule biosynthesis protein CapA/YwtB (metallophosphatase superfamily)
MKLISLSLVLSLVLQSYISSHTPEQVTVLVQAEDSTREQTDSVVVVTIGATGDLMCHSTQFKYASTGNGRYDFSGCFAYVEPYIAGIDYMIGNLETTLAGTRLPYSGYPDFNTPDDYVAGVKAAGFDMLVTANNHSNDTGERGIIRTLAVLDSLGMDHTGTYAREEDRSPFIKEMDGIRIAFLAYTYSTNGKMLPAGKEWMVNPIDGELISRDIAAAKSSNADIVVVVYHFGQEYKRAPDDYQQHYARVAMENGADIILGSHPHVLQPAGRFVSGKSNVDTGFIAWSMGNFISNQQDEYTDEGIIYRLSIEKNLQSGSVRISDVGYLPTWVYKGKSEALRLHAVFPAADTLHYFLGQAAITDGEKALQHTTSLLSGINGTILE